MANGPVEGGVDQALAERGVRVLPDVLANAGGVTVSYFEWVQNRQGYAWTLEEVRARLADTMHRVFDAIWEIHERDGRPLRSAAYQVAMERIAATLATHGTHEYFRSG